MDDLKDLRDELEIKLLTFKTMLEVVKLNYKKNLRRASQLEYLFGKDIDIQKMDFQSLKRLSHFLRFKNKMDEEIK